MQSCKQIPLFWRNALPHLQCGSDCSWESGSLYTITGKRNHSWMVRQVCKHPSKMEVTVGSYHTSWLKPLMHWMHYKIFITSASSKFNASQLTRQFKFKFYKFPKMLFMCARMRAVTYLYAGSAVKHKLSEVTCVLQGFVKSCKNFKPLPSNNLW
jgi:hypothetical protein